MLSVACIIVGLVLLDRAWFMRETWHRGWYGLLAGAVVSFGLAAFALPNFLYVQKVVALLIMPLGLVWCSLGAGALVARFKAFHVAALSLGTAFVLLGVAANPWLGRSLLASLEAPYTDSQPLREEPFDAVFVMGGGTSLDGQGNPILGPSGDRVMLGARLWHAGVARHLVPSGSSIAGIGKARDVGTETEIIWMSLDLPDEAVTPLPEPRNSSEEVAAYAALARERGWTRVGLVTSAWHMRRAMRLAATNDLDATPLPADFRGGGGFDGLISLIPSGFGARDVHRASWEYLGAAVHR